MPITIGDIFEGPHHGVTKPESYPRNMTLRQQEEQSITLSNESSITNQD